MLPRIKQGNSGLRLSPNTHLIGMPDSRKQLATPALLLDLDAFEYNLSLMGKLCRDAGIGLRPHAKAHKSTQISALQLGAGATGIATATVREAEAMLAAGITELLITSPIAGDTKIERLCSLIQDDKLIAVVDSIENALALNTSLVRHGKQLSVLVDIDIGMKRTGVATISDAQQLAHWVQNSSNLQFAGLQCYSGLIQHIPNATERAATYAAQLRHLERVISELVNAGLAPRIVSGGGTGSFDCDRYAKILTEVQPGSYIFMDSEYSAIELFRGDAQPFKNSLYVQAIVLSNHHPGHVTIDAGVKSFATDGEAPLVDKGAPPGARYDFDGDEFGMISFADVEHGTAIGNKVELVPPHCDPTANLHDFYHCVRGEVLVDIWAIDARGSL